MGADHHLGQGASAALAKGNDDAATVRLVSLLATIQTVFPAVLRADVTAEVGAVDLDFARQGLSRRLGSKSLAQLVRQDEGRLVLHVQVTRELDRGNSLRRQ